MTRTRWSGSCWRSWRRPKHDPARLLALRYASRPGALRFLACVMYAYVLLACLLAIGMATGVVGPLSSPPPFLYLERACVSHTMTTTLGWQDTGRRRSHTRKGKRRGGSRGGGYGAAAGVSICSLSTWGKLLRLGPFFFFSLAVICVVLLYGVNVYPRACGGLGWMDKKAGRRKG